MTKNWVHRVGHSPVCQILLQIVVRAVITFSPPAWTSSAGMLSTPADFRFLNDCTAASTSLRRTGWSSSVSVWVHFSTNGFFSGEGGRSCSKHNGIIRGEYDRITCPERNGIVRGEHDRITCPEHNGMFVENTTESPAQNTMESLLENMLLSELSRFVLGISRPFCLELTAAPHLECHNYWCFHVRLEKKRNTSLRPSTI